MKKPNLPANGWNFAAPSREEGIREPVQAFEFMNRFYVQEGNKRVSVLKYFGAASIRARVTRILPKRTGTPENRVYFEFL